VVFERTIGGDELYDLSSDPDEMRSLAGSGREERREQMKARLLKRVEELRGDFEAERVDPEIVEQLEALGYLQ
jgi:hypothetical protein